MVGAFRADSTRRGTSLGPGPIRIRSGGLMKLTLTDMEAEKGKRFLLPGGPRRRDGAHGFVRNPARVRGARGRLARVGFQGSSRDAEAVRGVEFLPELRAAFRAGEQRLVSGNNGPRGGRVFAQKFDSEMAQPSGP